MATAKGFSVKILYVCGDTRLVGGIEKYNSDFIKSLFESNNELKIVQRGEGGLSAKVFFLLQFFCSYLAFRPQIIICGHLNFSPVCYFLFKFL